MAATLAAMPAAPTTPDLIRDAIVARIAAVPGVGHVHAYERYAATEAKMRDLYQAQSGAPILGWNVRRVSWRELDREMDTEWSIRGYMSLSDADASELAFDSLLDAIAGALRADPRLGGLCLPPRTAGPIGPDLVTSRPVMFAGVLCHEAHLKFVTRHPV